MEKICQHLNLQTWHAEVRGETECKTFNKNDNRMEDHLQNIPKLHVFSGFTRVPYVRYHPGIIMTQIYWSWLYWKILIRRPVFSGVIGSGPQLPSEFPTGTGGDGARGAMVSRGAWLRPRECLQSGNWYRNWAVAKMLILRWVYKSQSMILIAEKLLKGMVFSGPWKLRSSYKHL